MGIVWEAYHKGVPLLGVPENPIESSQKKIQKVKSMEKVGLNLPRIELVKKNVPLCVMILTLLLQKTFPRIYEPTNKPLEHTPPVISEDSLHNHLGICSEGPQFSHPPKGDVHLFVDAKKSQRKPDELPTANGLPG